MHPVQVTSLQCYRCVDIRILDGSTGPFKMAVDRQLDRSCRYDPGAARTKPFSRELVRDCGEKLGNFTCGQISAEVDGILMGGKILKCNQRVMQTLFNERQSPVLVICEGVALIYGVL